VNFVSATTRDASVSLTHSIRRNPLQAAAVGLGFAWLVFRWSNRQRNAAGSARCSNDLHLANAAGTRMQRFSQQAQLRGSRAWDRAEDLSDQIQGTIRELGDEAQDRVGELRHDIQSQVNRLGSR
jgi:hypothetical protein